MEREKSRMKYKIELTREELNDLRWALTRRIDKLKDECLKHRNLLEKLDDSDLPFDDPAREATILLFNESVNELNRNCEVYEKLKNPVIIREDEDE